MNTTLARHNVEPQARLNHDPRRPGRLMLAVWCWCGRFYTLSGESVVRHAMNREHPCPSCGPLVMMPAAVAS